MVKKFLIVVLFAAGLASCETGIVSPQEGGNSTNTGGNGGSNNSGGTGENQAQAGVSTWHWGSETDPNGINYIIVDEAKATQTISSYLANNIKRLYGGYSRIPAHPTQKENLVSWNRRLKAAGIKSISLVGDAQWIYPENRQQMLDYITTYYINFNKSVSNDATLLGLHVDIEPHQLNEWKSASLQRKRELLFLLKDTYRDLRNLLISNGMPNDEITADIPPWFDEMNAIGWTSETDRNSWFADAAKYVNGFSIMSYETASIPTIISRTSWERNNFKGSIETGLNADEIGTFWNSKKELLNALAQIYSQTKSTVAIHNYATFMEK